MEQYILYPNLMSKDELLKILKDRHLSIPNLEQLSIDDLRKIYSKFALPLSSRDNKKSDNIIDNLSSNNSTSISTSAISQFNSNSTFNRIALKRNISELETNKDTFYNNKIIKLNYCNNSNAMSTQCLQKRLLKSVDDSISIEQNLDQCQQKLKRQKITWP